MSEVLGAIFGQYVPWSWDSDPCFLISGELFTVGGVEEFSAPFYIETYGGSITSAFLIDWPWVVGVFLFILTLVSVFKLIGGVLGGR